VSPSSIHTMSRMQYLSHCNLSPQRSPTRSLGNLSPFEYPPSPTRAQARAQAELEGRLAGTFNLWNPQLTSSEKRQEEDDHKVFYSDHEKRISVLEGTRSKTSEVVGRSNDCRSIEECHLDQVIVVVLEGLERWEEQRRGSLSTYILDAPYINEK
jgi:hypothetical protein